MKVQIKNSERVFFVGTTGSGKTELAKHFLSKMNRVLIIDPKHEFRLEGFRRSKELPLFGRDFKIIYRPKEEDDYHLSNLVYKIFRGKNATIYVDELATITEQFPMTTLKLAQVAREGREKKVALWNATQRPRWIKLIFKSESEVFFQFFLRDEDDRKHMTGFLGKDSILPIDIYDFWYSRPGMKIPSLLTLDLPKGIIVPVTNKFSIL